MKDERLTMSEKELEKLSKELEKAENSARIHQFDKAASRYGKLAKMASDVQPQLVDEFVFYQKLYSVNHDIVEKRDPLETGQLDSLDSLQSNFGNKSLVMALPGGIFGEYDTSRVFDETRGIILLRQGQNERNPDLLQSAIDKFLHIGKSQLFFGRYVKVIGRRISGTRAALECEAIGHVIRATAIADANPSGAIPHLLLATRAFRAARRNDLESRYRLELVGLRKVRKCWFCGRTVQGANHFRLMKSKMSSYFSNLLESTKEDMRVFEEDSIVACLPCAEAIGHEADRIAQYYYSLAMKRLESIDRQLQQLRTAIAHMGR